jgi:hypothetical protein
MRRTTGRLQRRNWPTTPLGLHSLMLGLLIVTLAAELVEFLAMLTVKLVSLLRKPIVELAVYFGKQIEMLVWRPRKHFETPVVLVDRSYCCLEVMDLVAVVLISSRALALYVMLGLVL